MPRLVNRAAFPAVGRLRQLGESYVWQPVVYSDKWISR
jgi:hypothetical protein